MQLTLENVGHDAQSQNAGLPRIVADCKASNTHFEFLHPIWFIRALEDGRYLPTQPFQGVTDKLRVGS